MGTRLYPLTQTRAKSLLPLAGVPMLHRIVRYLEGGGFDPVVITLGNFSRQVRESFKGLSVDVRFSEEGLPLGTAGSVKNARRHIDGTFLVIQGDNVTDMSLAAAKRFHAAHEGVATLLLKERDDVTGLGVVELGPDSRVSRFVEKPPLSDARPGLVNTGLYLMEPEILDQIPDNRPFDFARDLFPSMLENGSGINGLPMDGYWIDVGRPSAYKEACGWFLRQVTEGAPKERGGDDLLVRRDSFVQNGLDGWTVIGPSIVGAGSVLGGRSVIDGCVLEKGVVVEEGAVVRDSVILEDSRIEAGATVESAIVGEGSRVGRGSFVERGVILGGCAEVRPGSRVGANSVIPARTRVGDASRPSESASPEGDALADPRLR